MESFAPKKRIFASSLMVSKMATEFSQIMRRLKKRGRILGGDPGPDGGNQTLGER